MTSEEILSYVNEDSPKGKLSRVFETIITDFQAGNITAEERDDLVNAVVLGFLGTENSQNEELARWVESAVSVVKALA